MVRHHNISDKLERPGLLEFTDGLKKQGAVALIEKGPSPVVAVGGYEVKSAWQISVFPLLADRLALRPRRAGINPSS